MDESDGGSKSLVTATITEEAVLRKEASNEPLETYFKTYSATYTVKRAEMPFSGFRGWKITQANIDM